MSMMHQLICTGDTCPRRHEGESEAMHAWRTIPAECRGVTPPRRTPLLRAVARRARSLVTAPNIVTAACYSALMLAGIALLLAWFLDWKMP